MRVRTSCYSNISIGTDYIFIPQSLSRASAYYGSVDLFQNPRELQNTSAISIVPKNNLSRYGFSKHSKIPTVFSFLHHTLLDIERSSEDFTVISRICYQDYS